MAESSNYQSTIVLREPRQYEAWKQQIKSSAIEHDLWKYIDPEIREGSHPVLSEPIRPISGDVLSAEDAANRRRSQSTT
jgi:hypothetical protein